MGGYIQDSHYWGNSYWGGGYWGGGYWGLLTNRHTEIFKLNLVMTFSIETLGIVKMEVPAVQVMNKLISDRYDELEEV